MDSLSILFYLFSAILLFAAVRVVTAGNPVHSALYLVLAFFSAAAIWILLKAELLALILVLVYVGAVMVLFLFVVMMIDINVLGVVREGFKKYHAVGLTAGFLIALQMVLVLVRGFWASEPVLPKDTGFIGKTSELGRILYTGYLYPFEIAAVILMVAIVAAVALTLRKREDATYTSAAKASGVKKEDRLRIVEVLSENSAIAFSEGSDSGEKEEKTEGESR